jgi:hypothetical protein
MIATRLASAWRWDVPGSAKSPTAGLKTAPDVNRERFLTKAEAHRLLSAIDADENPVAAPLFDTQLFTRHIESAYAAMLQRYQAACRPITSSTCRAWRIRIRRHSP